MSSYSHVRKNVKNDLACVTPVVFSVVGLKKASGWLFFAVFKISMVGAPAGLYSTTSRASQNKKNEIPGLRY